MKLLGTFRRSSLPIGLVLLSILLVFAIIYPLVSPHDGYLSDFTKGATLDGEPVPPLRGFLLGTDRIFRDQATRLALGLRLSFYIALVASALSVCIGSIVGTLAGYFEGTWLDTLLMRAVDVGLSFPFLLLVMAFGVVVERTSATTILLLLGVTGWLSIARLVRAKVLQLRAQDFIAASRAMGAKSHRVIVRHVAPNLVGTMLVLFAISTPQMMMADSALSYLGVGIAPPSPTLGYMLFEGQDVMSSEPWILLCPSVLISLTVFAFHLVAEPLEERYFSKRREVP